MHLGITTRASAMQQFIASLVGMQDNKKNDRDSKENCIKDRISVKRKTQK